MTEALPNGIVARLEELGRQLVDFARQHRDEPLAQQERGVLEVVRQALPDLLLAVLELGTSTLQGSLATLPQPCPSCGRRTRIHSWRKRQVLTICGKLQLERPWYVCQSCQQGFSPADARLELTSRTRLSAELRAWLVELGAATSFQEAARLLERLTGLEVSDESIRQHTERVGSELEEAQQEAVAKVVQTQESVEPMDPAPGTLVLETDGVMVRYLDGFHEVKLGLVAGQVAGKLVKPSYLAVRASLEQFGPRLLVEAARRGALEVVGWEGAVTGRGLAVLRKVVVLGDGAVWIWSLASEYFGQRIEIVDYYHACEHIWSLANAFYGEGTPKAKAWAQRQCHRLLDRGAQPLLRVLQAIKGSQPETRDVLRRERGYFRTNAHRMDYPRFHKLGLPIGSGAVESEAKWLIQRRMKAPGTRWSEPGAQAVLNVRSRLASHLPLAC